MRSGTFTWLASPPDVLAYQRVAGDDRRVVLVNQGPAAAVQLKGAWAVELASDGSSTAEVLAADAAVVLRPA